MIGRVVSTKIDKTATVLVERVAKHSLYKKTFIRSKKYLVLAEDSIKEGDMVEIIKIRPVSKNKHWKVTRVIGRSLTEINEEKLKAEALKIIAEVMPEEKTKELNESEVEEGKQKEAVENSAVKEVRNKSKKERKDAAVQK